MTSEQRFRELCRDLCDHHGWELRPNGVHVPLPGGRGQVVSLDLFQFEERDMVRLTTVIGSASAANTVRLNIAMRLNAELAHGAFAVREDDLIMTDTLLLADVDPDELEGALRYLAETADRHEEQIFGTDQH